MAAPLASLDSLQTLSPATNLLYSAIVFLLVSLLDNVQFQKISTYSPWNTSFDKPMIIRKCKKNTKIADMVFEENYLSVSWPNFSPISPAAASLDLKGTLNFLNFFVPRKKENCIFFGVLPTIGL